VADALLAAMQAGGVVGEVALVLLVADRQADVRQVALAVHALATLRGEQRDDVVADGQARDVLTDRFDDARALVAEDRRRVAARVDARRRVHVGVADATCRQAHEHLAGLRAVETDVLDDQRLAEFLEDGGANLHAADPTRGSDLTRLC